MEESFDTERVRGNSIEQSLTEIVSVESVPEIVPVESVPEIVPVESVPVESVPVESVPVESVPVESVPVESVPVESVPVESVPLESVPVESVPVEPVPVEPVPVEEPEKYSVRVVEVEPLHPKMVFIVPYRDREQHLSFFTQKMAHILEDIPKTDYVIYVIHQNDTREFNRGAIKNIGFLYVKSKYPNEYLHMTLVFNDVDTMPIHKNHVNYNTTIGTIKHFCGYTYALGGIVSITGADFEKINGFPNFWAWGYEDNALQYRATKHGIRIDRTVFDDFKKTTANFISLSSGTKRTINKVEYQRYIRMTREGIRNIQDINSRESFEIFGRDEVSYENRIFTEATDRSKFEIFGSLNDLVNYGNIKMIHVLHFDTGVAPTTSKNAEYDLTNGPAPFGRILYRRNGSIPSIHMCL